MIEKLQLILSVTLISVVLLVTGIIALYPVISGVDPKPYTDHLMSFTGLYSGVIVMVFTYLFMNGKRSLTKDEIDALAKKSNTLNS